MKFLHIEDHVGLAESIQDNLQRLGHEVVWVDTIAAAKAELSKNPFDDGIICDGTVDTTNPGDGFRYALRLQAAGKKVVLFSTMDPKAVPEGLPFAPKTDFDLLLAKLLAL